MNIEQINSSKLLISLCDRELEEYDLNYETMDLKNEKTRSIIRRVLKYAENKTGMELSTGSLVIEAMKYDHGCLLLVTLIKNKSKKRYRIKMRSDSYLFSFQNTENMLSCMEQLYAAGKTPELSALYRTNYGYCMIVRCLLPDECFLRITGEFADKCKKGKIFCAAAAEKSRIIIPHRAISRIGSLLASVDSR